MPDAPDPSGIDLSDLDRFAEGAPHDDYRVLRDVAPVHWNRPSEHTPDGEGFWRVMPSCSPPTPAATATAAAP